MAGNYQSFVVEVMQGLEQQAERAMRKAVYRVHRELTSILSGSRTGRTYRVPGTQRNYVASAPLEAPAVRLGDLRTSYRPSTAGRGFNIRGIVGTPLDYGYFLEHGTQNIQPRPHLRPAFERTRGEVENIFKDEMKP